MELIGHRTQSVGPSLEGVQSWCVPQAQGRSISQPILTLIQTLLISLVSVIKHCRCVVLFCCCSVPPDTIMSNIGTTQILPSNARCTTAPCAPSNSSDHSPNLGRLRILYMPPVYAIVSFFSYRFFREYTYFELVQVGEYLVFYFSASFPILTCCSLRGSCPFLSSIILFLIPT